ncbi:MAG: TIM barrel protein [Clostridia bacterium]|nr:TIM barrel protein [Clostridia bacterium]
MIRFGPAGNSESFYEAGYKSSVEMPGWLKNLGLNAYEYQCSKGVKISEKTAVELGKNARENDIFLSIHAPYYINMSSEEEEKRENSKRYILESMKAAKWMGAKRIVIHAGSYKKVSREWAVNTAIGVLKEALIEADRMGYGEIAICPEVLGKANQLGTLDEILEMCRVDERMLPTVDFGHLHARGLGALNSLGDFQKVIETIENAIGYDRLKIMHCHFSRIEFTKAGEKRHWTLDDKEYGPDFEPLAEIIYRKNLEPVIICESRDKMAEDALKLKDIFYSMG